MNEGSSHRKRIRMSLKQKNIIIYLLTILAVLVPMCDTLKVHAAIPEITIKQEEYNLVVVDPPSFSTNLSSLYAKMNNESKPNNYVLSMFDDIYSNNALFEGLEEANVLVQEEDVVAMDLMLYEVDPRDGEYYPVNNPVDITILSPVPDSLMDRAEMVQIYQLSSSKEANKISSSLVKLNGVTSLRFTVNSTGVYGFVYTGVKDSNQLLKESNDVAVEPTKAPTVTKTVDENQKAVVSPQASKDNGKQNKERVLDSTPETGDIALIGTWGISLVLSGSGIIAIAVKLLVKKIK